MSAAARRRRNLAGGVLLNLCVVCGAVVAAVGLAIFAGVLFFVLTRFWH